MIEKYNSVYIIGIGGISLSAIALILQAKGIKVYGSDLTNSNIIDNLIKKGINVIIGHCKEFVKVSDAVIYTSAIADDDCDLLYAKKLNKPTFSRAEILGEISVGYRTISIAGAHGKTTATGMISSVFLNAECHPFIHIGGILNNISSNVLIGKDDVFITEACEYKDSFLSLRSFVSVILNIKPDHLDYFKNIDNEFKSFQKYVDNTTNRGVVVLNADDELSKKITTDKKIITFAIKNKKADILAKNILEYEKGKFSFDVKVKDEEINIKLPCYGFHNIYNALATISVCSFFDINLQKIKEGLEGFKGIKRRFEYINTINNNVIIHDYAHHPEEIEAVIKTGKEISDKLIVVFQPHTFTRTRDLYDEFLTCFDNADEVWLLPIYPAREKAIKGVTSFNLAQNLKKHGKNVKYFSNFTKCRDKIIKMKNKNYLIEILGAGDIEHLADLLK